MSAALVWISRALLAGYLALMAAVLLWELWHLATTPIEKLQEEQKRYRR